MSLAVTHAKVSLIADPTDPAYAGFVLPSDWDAAHTLTGVASVAQGGTGQATYTPSLSLSTSTTPASNVNTAETDLQTYSLPAGQLAAAGNKVRITAYFTTASNANAKTRKLYFGGTVVATRIDTINGTHDILTATVIRTGAATQYGFGWSSQGLQGTSSNPAETLSGAITIKATGQSGTASGDVTCTCMMVEFLP